MCCSVFKNGANTKQTKKINNKHKTRSLDHSSKSDLASVPTTSTIRLISVICWLSQLLWFHHSLRNVSSTHLDFIISLVLWVHEMPQTDIQEKNKSINYNQKEKKISFFRVTLQSVSYCITTKSQIEMHHYNSGHCKPAHNLFCFSNVQILCIFGFYFILLIKSSLWSQVNRAIFQSIVTISFFCPYLITVPHMMWFWNQLELKGQRRTLRL